MTLLQVLGIGTEIFLLGLAGSSLPYAYVTDDLSITGSAGLKVFQLAEHVALQPEYALGPIQNRIFYGLLSK